MQALHKALEDALGKSPETVFEELLARKLKVHGIQLSRRQRRRLREKILRGDSKTFHLRPWRFWDNRQILIEFTPEEIQEFGDRFVAEQLPQVIEALNSELASRILALLKRRWRREWRQQRRELANFQRHLHSRWDVPLGLLRMLLTISREFGGNVNQELRTVGAESPNQVEVLTRLHARACQVTEEILVLLSAGLADGAMARWRTLHEIAVIALFIGQHGEDLAERYVQHQTVESRRAATEYAACQESLGLEALDPVDVSALEHSYEAALSRYGTSFSAQYGWASQQLGIKKPTFADIERALGIGYIRPYYRMATYNVHANPKGAFFKLGLLEDTDLLLAGPSDLGLAEPGHCAAISLVQVSAPLGVLCPTLDNLVALRMMFELEGEVGHAFGIAHEQLVSEASPTP